LVSFAIWFSAPDPPAHASEHQTRANYSRIPSGINLKNVEKIVESEKTEFPLRDITLDQRLQPRAALDEETVEDYAARYAEGADMPAVTLFHDGDAFWLADGFHRIAGAAKAGRDTIPATVREGAYHDALLFAAAANASHGLRRTNADKRRAVSMLLGDPECSEWPDREIARHCAVHHQMVGTVRAAYLGESSRCGEQVQSAKSQDALTSRPVTRNGKTYMMNVSRIGKRRAVAPESPQAAAKSCYNANGLLSCPFCGDENASVNQYTETGPYVARCVNEDCGATGPLRHTKGIAENAWNYRCD
jgi:hypothetical protein